MPWWASISSSGAASLMNRRLTSFSEDSRYTNCTSQSICIFYNDGKGQYGSYRSGLQHLRCLHKVMFHVLSMYAGDEFGFIFDLAVEC